MKERVSATLDRDLVEEINAITGNKRKFSAFLNEAVRHYLRRYQALKLLDELDAKHGAPTSEEQASVRSEYSEIFNGK